MTREPFNLSIAECRKLTIHQLLHIYGHETDEHGNLVPMLHGEEVDEPTPREKQIRQWMLYNGLSRKEAEIWWKESEEVAAWREQWNKDSVKRISEGLTVACQQCFEGGKTWTDADEMRERARLQAIEDERYLRDLAELRRGQVARREHKGRVW